MPPLPRTSSRPALDQGPESPPLALSTAQREALRLWVQHTNDDLERPARSEAVRRITDCLHSRHHTLDLSGLRLSDLPDVIFEMDWLFSLRLDHNQLSQWPEGLARLSNIRHIDLSGNQLTFMPDTARAYPHAHIVLRGNPLTATTRDQLSAYAMPPNGPYFVEQVSGPFTYAQALSQPAPPAPSRLRASPDDANTLLNPIRDNILLLRSLAQRDGWPERWLDSAIDNVLSPLGNQLPHVLDLWQRRAGGVGTLLPSIDSQRASEISQAEHAGSFGNWLLRLVETADHDSPAERVLQNTRVLRVLTHAISDPGLRAVIFTLARESIESCGDRIAMGLNQMEMAITAEEASRGQHGREALFEFGRTQYRLDILHQIAADHARRNGREDELVEVELAFQSGLHQRLALPIGNRRLLYPVSAQVFEKDLEEATAKILLGEIAPTAPSLQHAARLDAPADATQALIDAPSWHPLARSVAEHYAPWAAHIKASEAAGDGLMAQMHICLEELEARQHAGTLDTPGYLAACERAMFFANHGQAYRAALLYLAENPSM